MTAHRVGQDLYEAAEDYLQILDPGDGEAIYPGSRSLGFVSLKTSGAETRTLPDPDRMNVRLTLAFEDDGGDCVVTAATAINANGDNIMTFAEESDVIDLISVKKGSAYVWRVVGNDGVALSS